MVPQSSSREAQEQIQVAKHRAERPKIQQQFADLKRGLSAVTDEEWDSIPEVGNLTRKKRRRAEKTFVIPDSVLVGDRSKNEYENALDTRQQQVGFFFTSFAPIAEKFTQTGGLETPAESGVLTNFVEIGKARDKILSLKLDQVHSTVQSCYIQLILPIV
jgi:pre-mRNA-processing factor 6